MLYWKALRRGAGRRRWTCAQDRRSLRGETVGTLRADSRCERPSWGATLLAQRGQEEPCELAGSTLGYGVREADRARLLWPSSISLPSSLSAKSLTLGSVLGLFSPVLAQILLGQLQGKSSPLGANEIPHPWELMKFLILQHWYLTTLACSVICHLLITPLPPPAPFLDYNPLPGHCIELRGPYSKTPLQ